MHVRTHNVAAIGARPLVSFAFQEGFEAFFFHHRVIGNHAHVVFTAISIVEPFQSCTWKLLAFIAKPERAFCELFAQPVGKCTIVTSRNTTRTISSMIP